MGSLHLRDLYWRGAHRNAAASNAAMMSGALVVSAFLAGCGSSGQETAALALTPVPQGKARITLTRPSTIVYAGCPANIKTGAVEVASLASGGQTVFDVPAGDTSITASCWSYPGNFTLRFKAEAGRTYALEVAPRQDSLGTAVLFGAIGGAVEASVSENSGAFELKAAKGGV